VNANQVFSWRRLYRDDPRMPAVPSASQLIPVMVTAEQDAVTTQASTVAATIEIDLAGKYRVRVSRGVDAGLGRLHGLVRRGDRFCDLARPERHVAARQDRERIDPGDLERRHPELPEDVGADPERRCLARAEQPVMDVAARGVAGRALVADLFAGLDPLADADRHVAEVSVDAAVAVAVVDNDDVWQIAPHVANVEDMEIRPEVADPADLLVEMAAGRQDDPIVRRPDRCAAERGHVDPVVEELAVVDPLPAGDCLERQ